MSFVSLNIEYFPDPTRGVPVYFGYVYIGEPDTDPEVPGNQVPVTLRLSDGSTVVAIQPIRTGAGGVALYNGSPVQVLVAKAYSLLVLDRRQSEVYYVANATGAPSGSYIQGTEALLADLKSIVPGSAGQTIITSGRISSIDGGGGTWTWDASDLSSEVSLDSLSGLYAAADSSPSGAFGAWVRSYEEHINVRWFGALGDGSTDDTDAISAAIIQAGAVKGVVMFPSSTSEYIINNTTATLGDGVGLKFIKGAKVTRLDHTTGTINFFTFSSNNVLDGIEIDADGYPDTGGIDGVWKSLARGIFSGQSSGTTPSGEISTNVTITNCNIYNIEAPYRLDGINASRITNNRAYRVKQSAFLIMCGPAQVSNDNLFDGNEIRECRDAGIAWFKNPQPQVVGEGHYRNIIVNNSFIDVNLNIPGAAIDLAEHVEYCGDEIVANNVVDNSNLTEVTASSRKAVALQYGSNTIIADNRFIGGVSSTDFASGISVHGQITNIVISGNIISRFGLGVSVTTASNVIIKSNQFHNCGHEVAYRSCVYIAPGSVDVTGILIDGNYFSKDADYEYTTSASNCLYTVTTGGAVIHSLKITNNIFNDSAYLLVNVRNTDACVIQGNSFLTRVINGGSHIKLVLATKGLISDNMSVDLEDIGYVLDRANGTLVVNNYISTDSAPAFISYPNTSECTVRNNHFYSSVATSVMSSLNWVYGNSGYVTDKRGVVTAIGNTAVVSDLYPDTTTEVTVTPRSSGVTDFYVSALSAGGFTITYTGPANATFSYNATSIRL